MHSTDPYFIYITAAFAIAGLVLSSLAAIYLRRFKKNQKQLKELTEKDAS